MTNDVHAKLVKFAFVVKLAFSFIFIADAVGYGFLSCQERLIYGLIIDIDYLCCAVMPLQFFVSFVKPWYPPYSSFDLSIFNI